MLHRVITLLLFATVSVEAQANTANFDALPVGAMYGSGSGFSDGGLDFDVLNAQDTLNVKAAANEINPSFSGNFLQFSLNNLLNVNLPTGASQINFDFILNLPAVAFDVNGRFLTYDQIPTTVDGVTITQSLGSTTTPWGSITASGNINIFIIYGTEFSIDNLNATLLPGLAGDYNKDQAVDAADYAVWRKTLNTPSGYESWRTNFGRSLAAPSLPGDFNHDGTVDAADYVFWRKASGSPDDYETWRTHFGQMASSGSGVSVNATIPEPATSLLVFIVLIITSCSRHRSNSSYVRRATPLPH